MGKAMKNYKKGDIIRYIYHNAYLEMRDITIYRILEIQNNNYLLQELYRSDKYMALRTFNHPINIINGITDKISKLTALLKYGVNI